MKTSYIVYCASIIVLTIAVVIGFFYINSLENRLNTHFKYDVDKQMSSEKSFKEDYYITQQNRDTTLILACFGVGFMIFSYITYISIERKYEKIAENIKAKNDKHELYINHLELDSLIIFGNYYSDSLDSLIKNNQYHDYFTYLLRLIGNYSTILNVLKTKNIQMEAENKEERLIYYKNEIITSIKNLHDKLNEHRIRVLKIDYQSDIDSANEKIPLVKKYVDKATFKLYFNIVGKLDKK